MNGLFAEWHEDMNQRHKKRWQRWPVSMFTNTWPVPCANTFLPFVLKRIDLIKNNENIYIDMQTREIKLATGWEGQRYLPLTVKYMKDLLVRTPPQTGPTMPIRRMAMGMNRAILCWRSVARESRAAGRWKTREETAAHRNTPYHISGQTDIQAHISPYQSTNPVQCTGAMNSW